jgi:Methyltransferase domain
MRGIYLKKITPTEGPADKWGVVVDRRSEWRYRSKGHCIGPLREGRGMMMDHEYSQPQHAATKSDAQGVSAIRTELMRIARVAERGPAFLARRGVRLAKRVARVPRRLLRIGSQRGTSHLLLDAPRAATEAHDNEAMRGAIKALEAIKEREAYARKMSLPIPHEVGLIDNNYHIKIKIDHEGVFRPRSDTYTYNRIKQILDGRVAVIHEYMANVSAAATAGGFDKIPADETDPGEPFIRNPLFHFADPVALYGMIGHLKPKRIIEVGSGFSTRFIRRAIKDAGLATQLTCIDPVPRSNIAGLADRLLLKPIQEIDLDIFKELEENDILFWDGSHIVFNGTDSVSFYLEILPELAAGVHVHVHDIQLPNEYHPGYAAHYYNEQYMLATLLLNSDLWQPTLPLHYIGENIDKEWSGRSFWMKNEAEAHV